jgi:hypothetical protein
MIGDKIINLLLMSGKRITFLISKKIERKKCVHTKNLRRKYEKYNLSKDY